MTPDAAARVRAARHWAPLAAGSLPSVRAQLDRCAERGVTGVIVPQVLTPPWATLAAAAACSDLDLASGIALAFVRSPLETAMAALDLDRLSGGRFTLGLGSSVRAWNVDRYGVAYDRPVARLRELVGLVRRLVSADEQASVGRFDGEFWSLDLRGVALPAPVRARVPVALAPLRASMTAMAAEVGDAILGHPIWSTRWIAGPMLDAVAAGLARAGRDRDEIRITAWLRVVVTDDRATGIADAKLGLPFYLLAQYASYFADLGLADDAAVVQRLAADGADAATQAAAVSDALAEELVVVGTPDEVAERVAAVLEVVDDVCLTVPPGIPAERSSAYDAAIAEHLLPGRQDRPR
jgi:alkanesulfonate monooxygenase SsuD/methylene tetrahydromethanopterin reductase-like flavin-dependent oxidoreductase (luciferase family)